MTRHRAFSQWLLILVASVIVAGAVVFVDPEITGFAVRDTGASIDFEPEPITAADLLENASSGLVIIIMLIVVQIVVYFLIMRIYKEDEVP